LVDWHVVGAVGEAVGGVGALLTAVVAIVAAIYAKRQLDEAKKARNPRVFAFLESDPVNPQFVDLVVKNFGERPAFRVGFTIKPRPKVSADDAGNPIRDLPLPPKIRQLQPGGEWRTRWDFWPNRAESGLPDRHKGYITYQDRFGREYQKRLDLDFAPLKVIRFQSPT
jgi:hypothetical protein